MAVIKSVSITENQSAALKKYDLSISKLVQAAIDNAERYETGELQEGIEVLKKRMDALEQTRDFLNRFIEAKGLKDELLEFK